MKFMTMNKQLL